MWEEISSFKNCGVGPTNQCGLRAESGLRANCGLRLAAILIFDACELVGYAVAGAVEISAPFAGRDGVAALLGSG